MATRARGDTSSPHRCIRSPTTATKSSPSTPPIASNPLNQAGLVACKPRRQLVEDGADYTQLQRHRRQRQVRALVAGSAMLSFTSSLTLVNGLASSATVTLPR